MTSDKIKQAELLARFVHLEQIRDDGKPYISHCERIVASLRLTPDIQLTEDMLCAAWLHDTIEDAKSRLAIHMTIANYFSAKTMHMVAVLTHEKHETYYQYIERIAEYPDILLIKFTDLIDNTSDKIPEERYMKYMNACIHLKNLGVQIPDILIDRLKINM